VPRSRDMAILGAPDRRQTTDTPITLPLLRMHARGVSIAIGIWKHILGSSETWATKVTKYSSGVGSTGAPGAGAPMKFSWVHTGLYSGILEGSGSKTGASPSWPGMTRFVS
jgi:hypothetical protein